MTTRTMGQIVLALGALGTVLLIVSGWLGLEIAKADVPEVRLHVLVSLVAVLVLMLSHGWISLFLASSLWAIAAASRESGADADESLRPARTRAWIVLAFAFVAVALAAINFLVGTRAFAGDVSVAAHHWLSWLTLAFQLVAWFAELYGLSAFDRLLGRVEELISTANSAVVVPTTEN